MATSDDVTITPQAGAIHIDALISDTPDWNFLGGNTIAYTFSVSSGTEPGMAAPDAFNAQQEAAARAILVHVQAITGIVLVETSVGQDADLHFGAKDLEGSGTTGFAVSSASYSTINNELVAYSADAWIYLDNAEWNTENSAPVAGNSGYETLLHEVGHALGLKHPFEEPVILSSGDNTSNTVMSYTQIGGPYSTFQPYDVAALKFLYGEDGLLGSIGVGTSLHLVTGTSSNDSIVVSPSPSGVVSARVLGLSGNDRVAGGAGNDFLAGGGGFDTAAYAGSSAATIVTHAAAGYKIIGAEGTDTAQGFERLEFGHLYILLRPVEVGDFNADGKSDLVLRDHFTGTVDLLLMDGTTWTDYSVNPWGTEWRVSGAQGDLNNDGKSDIVIRNDLTSQVGILLMDGKTWTSYQTYDWGAGWQVVDAEGDFNNDGKSDMVIRNDVTGVVDVLLMDGVGITSFAVFNWGTEWQVIEAQSDFNADGKSDIVIRNDDGRLGLLLMDGLTATSYESQAWGSDWQVVSAKADFNADGKSDILMRNEVTGSVDVLLMNDLLVSDHQVYDFGADWQVADVGGDFDNDGKSDMVLRNDATGTVDVVLMDGKSISNFKIYDWGLDWRVADASSDFDNDGRADLVIDNHVNGNIDVLLMNGMDFTNLAVHSFGTPWDVVA